MTFLVLTFRRSSQEKAVCQSVCLSVKRMQSNKKEKKIGADSIYHTKDLLAEFSEKMMDDRGNPLFL